jgi:hypothetical protein
MIKSKEITFNCEYPLSKQQEYDGDGKKLQFSAAT